MAKKLQQFYILKIESDRLKEDKYRIKQLSVMQARLNGELVALSDSQLIRTIFRITNREFSQSTLDGLLIEKKKLTSKKNNKANREKLARLNDQIDSTLFVPEIISIAFANKKHYEAIINKGGFFVNGIRYLPFMASAGMVRRNSALFIDANIKQQVGSILDNGRNTDIEFAPAKFSAYFSLYSSSSLDVTFPKIAVVPDLIIKTLRRVDFSQWVGEGIDPIVEEKDVELECNAFDGQGLVSPSMAKQWADDLELDYVPASFMVRSSYIKGLVATFDFHEFAQVVARKNKILDVYKNEIDIRDVDVIISESQFKLWNCYTSSDEYVSLCEKNGIGWGVSNIAPKENKSHAKSSYQFLQVLNLSDEDIENLCEPTIKWLEQVSSGDYASTLLYSMGDLTFEKGWFDRLEPVNKALLLEEKLLEDSHVIDHFDKSISKKKKDACMGRLIFSGNYQTLLSDPYAQCCHIFGIEFQPLLQEDQHYSRYWNERGVKRVVGVRSPIVHSSEVDLFNLQNNNDVNHWYRYLTSGVVLPAYGVGLDPAILGGSDVDGDLVCTIDQESFLRGRQGGLPIVYDTSKASKMKIAREDDSEVVKSHIKGFNQKVGFLTNVSTALTALLSNFERGSREHSTILQRLKYGRTLQGLEIDKTKGLVVPPFPEHWVKWKKTSDLIGEEKEQQEFYNTILADKRPYFMRHLYPHYDRKHKKEESSFNNIAKSKWGMSLAELMTLPEKTEEQQRLLNIYHRKSFFIDNNSTMNRISHHVEACLKEIRLKHREKATGFDFEVLLSENFKKPSKIDIDKMMLLYKEYKSYKRDFRENNRENERFSSLDQIAKYISLKAESTINSNASELADLAVHVCYTYLGKHSRRFMWECFGEQIVENMRLRRKSKFVRVPRKNPDGKTHYLWERYSFYLMGIED